MNTNDFEDEPTTLGFDPAWDDYNEPTVIYEWGTTNHQYVQAAEVLDRLDAWPN